jgi:hypothetical protein
LVIVARSEFERLQKLEEYFRQWFPASYSIAKEWLKEMGGELDKQ